MKFAKFLFVLFFLVSPFGFAEAFVVNHTNLHLFDQIPSEYITAAKNLRMMWGDRSVGGNINEGLTCLSYATDELAPNHCKRNHSNSTYVSPVSELDWSFPSGYLSRNNWTFFFDPGLGVTPEYTCPGYSPTQFDWIGCFNHFVRNNANNYDVFSYQHSYLAVASGSNITSPTLGYFVNRSDGTDIYDFESLETEFPSKKFFYWTTSLSRGIGSQESVDYNNSMRQFASSRNKVLFDVADIESHDPYGNACYDNRDGVQYNTENNPDDGLNIPAICQHYTSETEGGHLGSVSVGKIRLAKGYWIVMAYLAGWRPDGGSVPPPTPPTSDTQAPTTPTNLNASPVSTSQINITWSASTDNVGVSGYRLERCQGSNCSNFSQINSPTGTSFSDTGLSQNTLYRYRVRAIDAAGNLSGYSSVAQATTQSTPTDTTPPVISNISVSSVTSSSATISWSTNESSTASLQYGLTTSYGSTANSSGSTSHSVNVTGLSANTVYNFRISATDSSSNNSLSSNQTFTTLAGSDTTAPTISITSPSGGTTVSGTVTVSANASDNVGVAGVQFLLDGVSMGAEDTSSPYSISWNTTTATNGTRTLTARARDTAGNTTTSSGVNVTVSNTVSNFTLTVSKTGTGQGTVTGTGINCGSDCTETLASGSSVTLSASPSTGSTFTGWSGGNCSGTGTCTVTLSANTTVTANFDSTTPPPPLLSGEDWPTAGANIQRTSNSSANVSTVSGVAWYRPIESYISANTQIITSGGRIYVATAKGLIVLNAETGDLVCRFDTELPVGTPTVEGGVVYVPGMDRKLYSLNAVNCNLNWSFVGGAGFSANPLVTGGRVYIGNRDGRFYAINTSNGSQAWSYLTGGPIMESAAFDNGVLYFASMDMYGYALNSSTGSLVWRTPQKLPGDRYAYWWPVVHGNYVIWSAASAYKLGSNPGDQNAPMPGIAYDEYFTSSTSNFAGTLITSSNGTHGWPTGSTVMDTVTGTTPYTLQSWQQAMPAGRVYAIVNKSNGVEPFYLPWLTAGENGDGQMHPPVSDGTNLYINNIYQGSSQNIPRSTVFAWKEGTTWLRRMAAITFAVDEPLILSMSNGRIFANLCCDREARTIVPGSPNFWTYGPGMRLSSVLPSGNVSGAYDPMWAFYDGEAFLERLGGYYKGNINSRNGVYNSHGLQNPLVPLAFTNASGQRVERLFTHRSNAIIAMGPSATKTYLPPVLANNNPSNTATTLSSSELTQRLENEIQRMVNLYLSNGTNGFLKPSYMQTGTRASAPATPDDLEYFKLPADTVYALSSAYPYLSPSLRANVLSYLSSYWQKYFVDNRILRIGYSSGTLREPIAVPPEVLTRMSQINDSTQGVTAGTHQRTFYAAWKYAQIVPSQAASIYATVRPMLSYPPPTLDIVRNPSVYNDYIAGYQGFINLYDLAGTNPDPNLRAGVETQLNNLLNTRINSFAKDHPWEGSVDNPTGINVNNYTRRFNCSRNFMYMTPELGSAMRSSAQYSSIYSALNEYLYVCPRWFIARDDNTFQEGTTNHIFDSHALFLAKAYVAGDTQANLSKWIDVPWTFGDLYYIQNLTAALQAGGTVPTPPPPSDTTAPTVSITSPTGGTTVSGTVTVSANATDNVGVAGVQFLLDGVSMGAEDTSSPYSISWNTTTATNGTRTLTARARDTAGNTTTSSGVNVTVSNTVSNFTLTVSKTGTGQGTVTGTGINCGSDCTETLASGSSVTLSASPSTGSTFTGWSGGNCSGTGTCTVTLSANTTVTANFNTIGTPLFTTGQRVQTTANLNVRSTASATGNLLGTQPSGSLGTVVSGPVSSGGYIWWNINYDSGADGWSVEEFLRAYSDEPTPPPPPPTSGGPLQISGVTGSASVPRYEKQEITFNISGGSATNFSLPYDPSAPAGVPGTSGITVNVQFSQNNFSTFNTVPAFYYQNFDYQIKSGRDWIAPTGEFSWKVRFAPPTIGNWQYRIVATDASGSVTSPIYTFSVTSSNNKGFIRVSNTDSRYFEFEDGTPFVGQGYNGGIDWFNINPISSSNSRLQTMGQNGVELVRTWLSQSAIFGSSWNPWYGMRGDYGGYVPRTGLTPLGDKMTLRMTYAESGSNRNTGYFEACRFMGGFTSGTAIKRNTNYKFIVSYRGFNISGPRNTSFPNYGLVLKMQNPANGNWHTNCYDAGTNNSTGLVISPYGGNNSTFTTLEGNWNSGNNDYLPMFYMALENVNNTSPVAGVYIESVEIREQLPDGTLTGPNIVSKPSMEHHLYFDQKNSFVFDRILDQAKNQGVYLKTVVLEKDDDILGTLTSNGTFGSFSSANFYGNYRSVTATRWLQQAWWRYLQARWGYSSNIHSWELVNEGDPSSDRHWTLTDEFGKYIRQFAPNHHLVTTSFWHSLQANNFWKSSSYPNVDYADLHAYVSTSQVGDFNISSAKDSVVRSLCGTNNTCFKNNMKNDAALYRSEHSLQAKDRSLGKPLIRGEGGLDQPTQQVEDSNLTRDTNGVWLHNLVWSGLDSGGMYDLYWWTNNIYGRSGPDSSSSNGLHEIFTPFRDFMSNVPINNGFYVDATPVVSNASNVRVLGQKDLTNKRAHVWIQNRRHTWCSVVGGVSGCPYTWDNSRLSGTVSISGFTANTAYTVDWWQFNSSGVLTRPTPTSIVSDASGNIIINLDTLPSTVVDVAVKIGNYSGGVVAPPPPSDTTAPTVSITSPTGGTTVSGTVTVSANATDNVGVAGVQFLLDGVSMGAEDTSSPYSISWNTTTATNGTRTLTARARDTAGNTTTSSGVNVTVSNTVSNFTLTVSKTGTGQGTVTGTGINCGSDCTETLASGSSVTLSASPSTGSTFTGWSGGNCSGTGTCTVTLSTNTTVTANFNTIGTPLFTTGQRVQTTANLNVRSTASATGNLLGTQPSGSLGTVVSGPVSSGGYIWWNINYDSGADGWSVEEFLNAYSGENPPTNPNDTTPPVISSINVTNITATSTRITWITNEPATSRVVYGTSQSYNLSSPSNTTLSTNHEVILNNLRRRTTYNYQVVSVDASGNIARSSNQTFTTASRLPKTPKVTNVSVTNGSVRLSWGVPVDDDLIPYELFAGTLIMKSTSSFIEAPNISTSLANLPSSVTSYTDNAVQNGVTYYYTLFSYDDQGVYSDPVFVSFTPGSTPTNPTTPGGGGGGSAPSPTPTPPSGGSGGVVNPSPTTPAQPTPAPSPTPTEPTNPSVPINITKPNLTRTVYIGTRGDDVVSLQNFLISLGYLESGLNTGYYGNATREAVKKYQCNYMQICSGDEDTTGYGMVGQRTRASIASVVPTKQDNTTTTNTTQTLTPERRAEIQKQINDLLLLVQQLLIQLRALQGQGL